MQKSKALRKREAQKVKQHQRLLTLQYQLQRIAGEKAAAQCLRKLVYTAGLV